MSYSTLQIVHACIMYIFCNIGRYINTHTWKYYVIDWLINTALNCIPTKLMMSVWLPYVSKNLFYDYTQESHLIGEESKCDKNKNGSCGQKWSCGLRGRLIVVIHKWDDFIAVFLKICYLDFICLGHLNGFIVPIDMVSIGSKFYFIQAHFWKPYFSLLIPTFKYYRT